MIPEENPNRDKEGYELLSNFGREQIIAIYEQVAKRGTKEDQQCPETFEEGVRLDNLVEEFENGFRARVRDSIPFTEIAAWSIHFFMWRQPLKNCNHRTGLGIMEMVLVSFGHKFEPKSTEDVLDFFEKFERTGMSVKEVEDWIIQNLSAI
ncbi:MAG: hypothetical protein ACE5IO_08490 [Thermoplasmata archaeon]